MSATVSTLAILIVIVLTVLASCGRKVGPGAEQAEVFPYETLWVDPQIILSDTLLTLIRADRIDSVLIDPTDPTFARSASVEIRIYGLPCNVSVNLLDAGGQLLHPIMVKNLPQGFYRLTVEFGRFSDPLLPPGDYVLQADYCGQINLSGFTVKF